MFAEKAKKIEFLRKKPQKNAILKRGGGGSRISPIKKKQRQKEEIYKR